MKIKVGDKVYPKSKIGVVKSINDEQVEVGWIDMHGKDRISYITKENAERAGKTLDQHVDDIFEVIK
jgi:hypothetical protein